MSKHQLARQPEYQDHGECPSENKTLIVHFQVLYPRWGLEKQKGPHNVRTPTVSGSRFALVLVAAPSRAKLSKLQEIPSYYLELIIHRRRKASASFFQQSWQNPQPWPRPHPLPRATPLQSFHASAAATAAVPAASPEPPQQSRPKLQLAPQSHPPPPHPP